MAPQPAHILLVDDEPSIRLTLSMLLQRSGYVVTTAADGDEAAGLIGKQTFDLVLLDLIMPGIGGLELARHIQRVSPETAIIVLTGSDALEDIGRSGFDYILKTTNPPEVLARVTATIARRRELAVVSP